MATAYPVADDAAARSLGEALRHVGYVEDAVVDLLGDEAYSSGPGDVPVLERRLAATRLATVVRLFFLQLPVPLRAATTALGRRAVDALEVMGLAVIGDDVSPHVRILPVGKLLVASDGYAMGDEPSDYVAAYTPTTRICDALTPRQRVARAVDVGTGSGAQALLAARHARHVVATDVNPRSLAFAQLNASMNGFTNVECRRGSLFATVAGETFDLITCNAPYVVSPEQRFTYRDSGLRGDEVSESVVHEAAAHLAEGGFATLLVSWIAHDEDKPDERVLEWTESLGCDSWILPVWGADALEHAASWNDELSHDKRAFSAALDEWTRYLTALDARWVSEGAVLLHRRAGRHHTARVDELDEETLEDAGEQIRRAFRSRARLAELRSASDLLDARVAVAAALELEYELRPKAGRTGARNARIVLAEGTSSTVETTKPVLDVMAALDGRARVRDVIAATAKRLRTSHAEATRLRRETLVVVRELLELGALEFA